MRQSRFVPVAGWLSLVVLVVLAGSPTLGQAPKYGGGLTLRLREDLPQGFAIHETATISTMWPAMPCFSNLVLFDPLKTTHRMDAIVGELAERWSWEDNDRSLVFFLRTGARWHDGTPVSSKDVKFTFDLLRETPDASARLRVNPRRDWYTNVAQWHPLQTRGDFQIGIERTGIEPDDPDANFYESYGCGSPRNYPRYCDEEISRLIDRQSQELNPAKRLALVQVIQRKLEEAAVRPVLGWRLDYYTVWPYVKNLVPHQSIYSWGRMQEVWLDK